MFDVTLTKEVGHIQPKVKDPTFIMLHGECNSHVFRIPFYAHASRQLFAYTSCVVLGRYPTRESRIKKRS